MQPNQPNPSFDPSPQQPTPGFEPQPQPQPQAPIETPQHTPEPALTPAPTPVDPTSVTFPETTPPVPSPAPSTFDTPAAPVNNFFGGQTAPTPEVTPTLATDQTGLPPVAPPPAPKKSKKPLIVALVAILALLLIGGGIAAALLLTKNSNPLPTSVTSGSDSAATIDPAKKESVAAAIIGDFKDVCNGKKISNAAEPTKPYKGANFIKYGETWSLGGLFGYGTTTSFADYTPEITNIATCMTPDESTATASVSCTLTDFESKEKFTITPKGVTYDLDMYAAKTGEKLKSDSVTVAAACPATDIGIMSTMKDMQYFLPNDAEVKTKVEALFAQ